MSLDAYYDAHAARVLHLPICVIGFFGADQERVGSTLGSLTALGFRHVPNLVAHKLGASVPRIIATSGEAVYRDLEDQCARSALADQPPGIVSLGDGALINVESRAFVVRNSVLVYLHHDLDEIVRRIRAKVTEHPTLFHPWIQGNDFCSDHLATLFEERLSGYEEATLQLNASGRTSLQLASELMEELQLSQPD